MVLYQFVNILGELLAQISRLAHRQSEPTGVAMAITPGWTLGVWTWSRFGFRMLPQNSNC